MQLLESEFRSYPYIVDLLKDMGWDTRSPKMGGQVYTQNEAIKQDEKLKEAFGLGRPEFTLIVESGNYWVIEAKSDIKQLSTAISQAKERAEQINSLEGISCRLITGFAGSPDSTHYIETQRFFNGNWETLKINKRDATGFITRQQAIQAIEKGGLNDYDIDDRLFEIKIKSINEILHNGAFHKKNRASTLACILLALANDPKMSLNDSTSILIADVNKRAEPELMKYGKQNFFKEIAINSPTSNDNHTKNRWALVKSIEILRSINITSAINSGRDILGQCYEQFLKYANDAKEIGVVLTPRHIANFASDVIDIQPNDKVFDPTCGTGGFLVAALDKVRKDWGDIDSFKKGNLYGIEQDALIATLAIVNMVFRGDGSSNIKEGNSLVTKMGVNFDKVLMNPPFAQNELEWQFVDRALESMRGGGLLFAILPTTTINSSTNGRREITWRKNLIQRHTVLTVIKLPENLFYPQVSKGTYGLIIQAHRVHKGADDVLWAVLNDGVIKTKTSKVEASNLGQICQAIKSYISASVKPDYIVEQLDCSPIILDDFLDLSPEKHIGLNQAVGKFDITEVRQDLEDGERFLNIKRGFVLKDSCDTFRVVDFFDSYERGQSGREKFMAGGSMPLISTSEKNNGISAMVRGRDCKKIYPRGYITISANGGSCKAHYHDYEFAANADVYVARIKEEYKDIAMFICASINSEKWKYNYYTKLTTAKLQSLKIKVPVKEGGVDFEVIRGLLGEVDLDYE